MPNLFATSYAADTIDIDLPNFHGLVDSTKISAIKNKLMSDNFGSTLDLNKMSTFKSNIEVSNFYASGQSVSYFGDGLYSDIRLEHHLEIAGLPIGMYGDLIVQNNKVNSRLSRVGIEFDQEAFLNKYREKVSKRAVQQSYKELLSGQKESVKEYLSVEASRMALLSEAYHVGKDALINRIDSLTKNLRNNAETTLLDTLKDWREEGKHNHRVDSLMGTMQEKADVMLLNSLKSLQRYLEKTESRVDSLYNVGLSKWNETQQALQEWRAKVLDQQKIFEDEIADGSLHKYVEKQNWKSLLLHVSRFKIGSFQLRGSPFDVSSIPLHGISMEVRHAGYYAAVTYGKEGRQRQQFPDYVRNLRLAGEGRTVLQVKAGIGMPEKTHFHVGFSSIRVKASTSDSIYATFPKNNVLVSLDSRYMISEQFFVEMLGSISKADFTGVSSTKELLGNLYDETAQGRNNLAGLARFGWKGKRGHSEYTVGYQTIGDNFVTLGNLFLLNNRKAIRLEGKQKFLKNRGQAKVAYVKGATNSTTEIMPGIQQNQFAGEFSYRLNKHGSRAWASYSPNFYQQNAPGSGSAVYQLNLATVGTQWMFKRGKKGQWMSMLQLTNYSDQSQYGDTSVVTGLWYGMLTQTYSSDKYLITGLANVGLDKYDLGSVRDINVDISQSFMFKNLQVSQGVQVVKRFYGAGMLVGGSGGVQFNVRKRCRTSFGGTYLIGVSSGERNQFYVNSSIGYQF